MEIEEQNIPREIERNDKQVYKIIFNSFAQFTVYLLSLEREIE